MVNVEAKSYLLNGLKMPEGSPQKESQKRFLVVFIKK